MLATLLRAFDTCLAVQTKKMPFMICIKKQASFDDVINCKR